MSYSGYSYHITTRCNNREFRLMRLECRQVFLYILKKAIEKYDFKLYGLCIMSNHIHYLIEPQKSEDLPKIMHLINWYSAMCFNRMLHRTGHGSTSLTTRFWEKRYNATSFPNADRKRALNTLRYIHANPKAAGMQQGFFYDFSNYGVYERLGDDGLTTWHPSFLTLGETLDDCARKYKGFCHQYQPKSKSPKRFFWGNSLLPKLTKTPPKSREKKTGKESHKKSHQKKDDEAQRFWELWLETNPEIMAVAEKFILANCFSPKFMMVFLNHYSYF